MRLLTGLLLITLLSACQHEPPAEALLDDYLTRLSRVLDVDAPDVALESPPRMPPARTLQVAIEPASINLLDFWSFRKCGLSELLGERNSVLGRVMVPSQHLHMDGRLLQQLRYCQNTLDDEDLLTLAAELEVQKREQWPARYWNATAAAPELRAFWSPSTQPLIPGREASYQKAEAALAFLADIPDQLDRSNWPTRSDLEAHYQSLDRYPLGGKLLQSLQLGYQYTEVANGMLESARDHQTLCPSGLQKPELEYARNVMVKVFVGEVQPWLAAVNRRANSLLEQYDNLLDAQADPHVDALKPFRVSVHEQHSRFQSSLREHVEQWQHLFDECGSSARP